ncbi:MAG: glycosyltransferase family 2 protein [Actinomycetota bacterium]|nr:glycosyltransferase family 2 protein [Actinomycetota bacterium]
MHEVILVDGRSVDGTVDIARSILPDIVVVTEARRGKGRALRAGFAVATGDVIVMLDGDGSMDPVEISRFVAQLRHEDFVKGSRCMAEGDSDDFTWVRRMGNRSLLALVNSLFGQPFTDLCYGFCAFRRVHLERLNLTADGFEIETELVVHAIKAGLRIAEVPSVELVRIGGMSNLRVARDGRRVLRTILHERLSWFDGPTALAPTVPTAADTGQTWSGAITSLPSAARIRLRSSNGVNGHQHGHDTPSGQPAHVGAALASSQ